MAGAIGKSQQQAGDLVIGEIPPRSATRPASRSSAAWIAPLLLVLITYAVYLPVCTFKFVDWDDYENVAQNTAFNPLTRQSLLHLWEFPYLDLYVPVTYTVWALLSMPARLRVPDASGLWFDPHIFHAANLLVHLLTVLIVYRLLLALCGRRWPACAGAMLFVLHPVQVEAVAWVTGLKDVLSGFFSIFALWQYVLFAQAPAAEQRSARRRYAHYALASASFALAILSKPSVVTLPLTAAAIDRLILRRRWHELSTDLVPWVFLAVGGAWVAHINQSVAPFDPGPWSRPILAAHALGAYLWKLMLPLRLTVTYQTPRQALAGRWLPLAVLLSVAAIVALVVFRRRAPWAGAPAIVFAAGVFPVLGFVPFEFERFSLLADRYLYLAMLGPALALSIGLTLKAPGRVAWGVCIGWLVLLGIRAAIRTTAWRDTETLFRRELEQNPSSSLACEKLAVEANRAGRPEQAMGLAERSIALEPDQSVAYVVLATILRSRGRAEEAQPILQQAGRASPPDPVAMADVAGMLIARKDFSLAAELCRKALKVQPDAATAHRQLALALAGEQQYAQALDEAHSAVLLAPNDAQMHVTLGRILGEMHHPEAAEHEFETAHRLSAALFNIRNNP